MIRDIRTRAELFAALAERGCQTVRVAGVVGILDSVQREDGSGRSFNVTLATATGKQTVYLRT
jgi:hypothetical protein